MRDNWYGDNRDIVKWSALIQLARQTRARTVVQVAFYRPAAPYPMLSMQATDGDTPVPIPEEVLSHLRKLKCIKGLACDGIQIKPLLVPWTEDRQAYIAEVIANLKSFQQRPLVALLDPDTGIGPDTVNLKHVAKAEIRQVYESLRRDDTLVVYQHAWRQAEWLDSAKERFASAIGVTTRDIITVSCLELASDVALFARTVV